MGRVQHSVRDGGGDHAGIRPGILASTLPELPKGFEENAGPGYQHVFPLPDGRIGRHVRQSAKGVAEGAAGDPAAFDEFAGGDRVVALAVSDDVQDVGIERLADGRRRSQVSLGPVEIGRHAREPRPDLPEDREPGVFQIFDQFPLRGHLGQIHRRRSFARRVEHELGHVMPDAQFFRVVRCQEGHGHGQGVMGVAEAPLVRFVDLDGDSPLGIPADDALVFGDRFGQASPGSAVEGAVPAEGNGAPGIMNGPDAHLRPLPEIAGSAVTSEEGEVAAAGGRVQGFQILGPPERNSSRPILPRIHLFGTEKAFLGILVGTQGENVQNVRLGDLPGTVQGFLEGGPSVMMTDQRDRAFPSDTGNEVSRIVFRRFLRSAAPDEGEDFIDRLPPRKNALEDPRPFGGRRGRRRPAEDEADACQSPARDLVPQLSKKMFGPFRRQPVAHGHDVRPIRERGVDERLGSDRGPQERRPTARRLAQVEEIPNPGHMDARAQGSPQDPRRRHLATSSPIAKSRRFRTDMPAKPSFSTVRPSL